jgi:hypothetical protein
MHYTSITDIHKVIDPLFLKGLEDELEEIKQYVQQAAIIRKVEAYQAKLAGLLFLEIIIPSLIQFNDYPFGLSRGMQNPSGGVHFPKRGVQAA